jgi:hypothetical protein
LQGDDGKCEKAVQGKGSNLSEESVQERPIMFLPFSLLPPLRNCDDDLFLG